MVLFFRMMQGIFTGTITAYLTLVVANTPKKRMGFAIGVLNSAIFCGNSLSPLLGGVFADWFGYRASFFVAAGLLFASFLTSLVFAKEKFTPRSQASASFFRDMRALILKGSVLSIVGMIFFYALSLTFQRPQLPLLIREVVATDHNLATQAGFVMSAAGVASVLAGMIFGTLADRGKTYYLGSACAVVGSGFVASIVLAGSVWQLAILNFLFAIAAGGIDPILKTILTHHVPTEQRGSAFGLIGSARASGWFLGSLGGGFVASMLGLQPIFLISAAFFVVIAGLLALLGRKA
jgi:MFS family permease